jgi:hypothetical protein
MNNFSSSNGDEANTEVTYSQRLRGDLRTQQTSHEDPGSILSVFYLTDLCQKM